MIGGLDTLGLTDEVSFRVKFLGEDKPDSSEPPNSACNPEERVNLGGANACHSLAVVSGCNTGPVIDYNVIVGDTADLYFVRSIDIDRDNYVDVIFTGSITAGLFVAYGNSNGALETPVSYLPISQDAFDFGYLDPDTLLDIIAVHGNTSYFLYNTGGRQFTVDSLVASTASGKNPGSERANANIPSIVTGYFNTDPYLDFVQAPDKLFYGEAGGQTFTEQTTSFSFDVAEVCDVDNSGSEDLITIRNDSVSVYLNDGSGNFSFASSINVGMSSYAVPPAVAVTDFNKDGNCDFAVVLPEADSVVHSVITVALGDGTGNISVNQTLDVDGISYNLSASDVNGDHLLDIVVANGSTGDLEVFYGDGAGTFSSRQLIDLGTNSTQTLALGALDIDRDGNIDFVSGELGGGSLVVAISEEPDDPVISDEMVVFGFSSVDVAVQNPDGDVISPTMRTVAGSDYQIVDINNDGLLDERTLDYNLQYGEYIITVSLEPDASGEQSTYGAAIGIDGSQQATIFDDYDNSGFTKADSIYQADSLIFYYTVEPVSSIQPPNGYPNNISRPLFDWSVQVVDLPPEYTYQFQLDRFYDFRNPIFDSAGLTSPEYLPATSLGNDSVFYWHYRVFDGTQWSEYSRTFAVYVTDLCCLVSTGNVDSDIEGNIDIDDLSYLVGYLFKGFDPPGTHAGCSGPGNVDGDGIINVIDLSYMVDYLFKNGPEPVPCP
jgi:hypothetical protein